MRFPEEIRADLEGIAKISGLSAADLVRLATVEYLHRARAEGGIKISIVAESRPDYGTKKKGTKP